ncbi:hypothetical protein H8788_20665 [Parabacteroides faecis]|uniref:DUF6261 family protein n=1 Tax=Parabacteroides TaxID=375288 RepID=UPI000F0007B6|nr:MULTISPECIES: DUF6261 family protein [Parabacteroides]MBC8620154.1 hypothetical protein [Parabacteroides faecis]RHS00923.1 hypothetical protein DWW23_00135 [Parabacteroides sp. AF14-59]
MEINKISITRMNNGAHYLYNTDFYARIDADTAVKGKLTEVLPRYKQAIDREDEALKISQKSLNTDKIADFDSKRDSLYTAIKSIVKAQQAVVDPGVHAAAIRIDQLLKDYRIDVKEQLDKETGLLLNLIQDLETKYAEDVDKLGLSLFLTQLKEWNSNVRSYSDSRKKEQLEKPAYRLAEARKATDEVYQEVVKQINAHALLEGDDLYRNLITLQNKEIVHYKQQVLKQTVPPVPGDIDTPFVPDTPSGGGGDDRPEIE